MRARFREGCEQPCPLKPGQVYEYKIDLVATSSLFQSGHRIRVDVTTSSFPRFDRNANTGTALGQDGPQDLHLACRRSSTTASVLPTSFYRSSPGDMLEPSPSRRHQRLAANQQGAGE